MSSTLFSFIILTFFISCFAHQDKEELNTQIITGAEQMEAYLPLLVNKKVGIVANQTSMVGNNHLVDTLLSRGVEIVKILTPEHGFRGESDAGEKIDNSVDKRTGLPIISLYGNHKKPTPEDLENIDILIFDIQDVGARFYTYISTMHYCMEACAENNILFLVFDRPNPNGFYVDGPVLEKEFQSFVGMHPVPVVHGMTIAEYALMINGEGWLKDSIKCNLSYISCKNYDHLTFYNLPIKPSPNLPNMTAIYLYPSLCLFEGTDVSIGRGTETPFQLYGHPGFPDTLPCTFVPTSYPGAKNPKHNNKVCYGYDLTKLSLQELRKGKIELSWLINAYNINSIGNDFFTPFFEKLAGTSTLRDEIIETVDEATIRQNWQNDIEIFKKIRTKYLIYTDFE